MSPAEIWQPTSPKWTCFWIHFPSKHSTLYASCRSYVNRRSGGMYHLHLQGRKIRQRGTSVDWWLILKLPAHVGFSFASFSNLQMEAIYSSEASVHTRSTRHHIPQDMHSLYSRLWKPQILSYNWRWLCCLVNEIDFFFGYWIAIKKGNSYDR
jgi:hypothetical protein